jgi:hypothetical protein
MPRIFWILVLLLSWFYFSGDNLFGILVFPFLVRNFWLPIKIRICRNDVPFSLLHIQRNQTFFSQKLGNESWDKKQRGYYCSGRWCGGLVGSGRAIRPESRLSISTLAQPPPPVQICSYIPSKTAGSFGHILIQKVSVVNRMVPKVLVA